VSFDKIAPYLQDPLVLAGFALFLFFGALRALLSSGLIPQQTQIGGYRILQRLFLFGFLLSVLIILLGFGLKYRELSRMEQRRAAELILEELKSDRTIAGSLAANAATSLDTSSELALVLRSNGAPLLKMLFPYKNLQPDSNTPAPRTMAEESLKAAMLAGLPAEQEQLDRMNAVARAIRRTLANTRGALGSLADQEGGRYRIGRTAWSANAPVIRRISAIDLTRLERTYAALEKARADYAVLLGYDLRYVDSLNDFLAFKGGGLDDDELGRVLAAERQYFMIAAAYGKEIADCIEKSGKSIDELSRAVDAA
jgi:hypothetical protein